MKKLVKALQMQQTFEIELGNYLVTVLGSIGVGMALMKMLLVANARSKWLHLSSGHPSGSIVSGSLLGTPLLTAVQKNLAVCYIVASCWTRAA